MFRSTLPNNEGPRLSDKTYVFNVSTGKSWEGTLAESIPFMPRDKRMALINKVAATARMEALLGKIMH